MAAGLLWLAMNFPAVIDARLDKVEYDAIDDPDPSQEPEPYCVECGSDVGIFLRDLRDLEGFCPVDPGAAALSSTGLNDNEDLSTL